MFYHQTLDNELVRKPLMKQEKSLFGRPLMAGGLASSIADLFADKEYPKAFKRLGIPQFMLGLERRRTRANYGYDSVPPLKRQRHDV
jgi:hypothetical protein